MRTKLEVLNAFTPNPRLTQVQNMALMKTNKAFQDLAVELIDLVPECADRTAALRKLLESKFTCIQAITHHGFDSGKNIKPELTINSQDKVRNPDLDPAILKKVTPRTEPEFPEPPSQEAEPVSTTPLSIADIKKGAKNAQKETNQNG